MDLTGTSFGRKLGRIRKKINALTIGGTKKVAEIVGRLQRMLNQSRNTARVAVGQGKTGETDRKHIILAVLVGVLV